MENMSLSDIAAVTKGNGTSDNFLWWILVLFFLAGGNGFGFGNKGSAVTQSELQMGLYNQTTNNMLEGINASINGVSKEVLDNKYTGALNTQTITSAIDSCCCSNKMLAMENTAAITNAIHSEGEATRALITSNRIADLEKELTQAQIVASNQVQTQSILNSIGRFVPYSGYGYVNGCGCMNGTTIIQ